MTTHWIAITCPYCGECFETAVEAAEIGLQRYVEDCAICCRPISFVVTVDEGGAVTVQPRRDDDAG
mgnify:CR=1 FL=1